MSTEIKFEGKKYDFTWKGIIILLVGAPILSILIYFSNDYLWLHKITAEITCWGLRLFTGLNFHVIQFGSIDDPEHLSYFIRVPNEDGTGFLSSILFTTLCTGVHAIGIFIGVITFIPMNIADTDPDAKKNLIKRKIIAMVICSTLFYFVNIARMWLQLWLYHIGYEWEDIHYSISAASSFIAIAAILVMHKWTPEFILSIIWITDRLRTAIKKADVDKQQKLDSESQDKPEENTDQAHHQEKRINEPN
jgi:exosortase/archaeosortase family protein